MVNINRGPAGQGNDNESGGNSGAPTYPQYLHELPQADEERLEKIFKKLDRDGNDRIDIHDLSAALKEFGLSHQYAECQFAGSVGDLHPVARNRLFTHLIPTVETEMMVAIEAMRFLKQSDQNQSGDVGLAEFIHYVREHEKNLRLQFTHLDKNQDGKVDLEELITAFKELGIEMDRHEAAKLLKRMDKDGSLNISYDEWRDFLLLAPSSDIHELVKYWRHSTNLWYNEAYLKTIGRCRRASATAGPDEPPPSVVRPVLALIDVEQAIEHATDLLLNLPPTNVSYNSSTNNGGASSHLLVDGPSTPVMGTKLLIKTCISTFRRRRQEVTVVGRFSMHSGWRFRGSN
uniref:EF-hand domain-containing protein n=1 Tax=Anopheles farauti TaxID=69004 RepID=A0A182QLB2_9DIPT